MKQQQERKLEGVFIPLFLFFSFLFVSFVPWVFFFSNFSFIVSNKNKTKKNQKKKSGELLRMQNNIFTFLFLCSPPFFFQRVILEDSYSLTRFTIPEEKNRCYFEPKE
jgi:hypothetical protein